MVRTFRAVAVGAILLLTAHTASSAQAPNNLNAPYQIRVGDYAAVLLSEFFKVNTDLDIPKIVTFEPTLNTIDVELMGSRGTVEGAREIINQAAQFVVAGFGPYVKRRLNVQLTEANLRFLYYDRTARGGPKLILTWDRGQLVVPTGTD